MAKGNVFSFVALQVWKYYNGYCYGQIADPTAPGADVTSHAYAMFDGITAGSPAIARVVNTFRGGGNVLGTVIGGVESVSPFDINLANYDDTLNTLVGNANNDAATYSGHSISSPNEQKTVRTQLGLMLTLQFQSRASGSDGDNSFLNLIYPNVTCDYQRAGTVTQDGGVNTTPSILRVAPAASGKYPWGTAFGTALGLQNNRTMMLFDVTAFPLALTTYIANGSATTFNLQYLPVYSTVTSGVTNNITTINGTATAATSISTSTKAVVIAAAGSSGDIHVVAYPTRFLT